VESERLIDEQRAYYRARASEYDAWFLRQGRYDRGEAHATQWFTEVARLEHALDAFKPEGDILELACGTGWWTERLAHYGVSLTAVDASPEVIALNRARLPEANITYVEADLFDWQPERTFDTVFFSFWLSHVPPEHFAGFWETVRRCLKPEGRVFLIDSRYEQASLARDHVLNGADATTVTRRLDDGRAFDIVKVFYEPESLAAQLAGLGWKAHIRQTETFFLYGEAHVSSPFNPRPR
jgi:2-polyprenyl-3-methyl-5-hydroxy-6-metoxy-1,4-benzoquinol methylase